MSVREIISTFYFILSVVSMLTMCGCMLAVTFVGGAVVAPVFVASLLIAIISLGVACAIDG